MSSSLHTMIKRHLEFGHQRFLDGRFAEQRGRYENLALGQTPTIAVVACADSRVDVATIFDAHPGELFIIRNVANLVPPFAPNTDYHATSAALEFAVKVLKVSAILVLGHSNCGGVKYCLDGNKDTLNFVQPWMSILEETRDTVINEHKDCDQGELLHLLTVESVRQSLNNLKSFDFVEAALDSQDLALIGANFDIATGSVEFVDFA